MAVDSVGLTSQQVTLSEGSDFVPGLGQFPPATEWAFHDSTFVDQVSPIYETDQGFAVLELVDRSASRYLSFDEAETSIRRRLTAEKKIETARWQAQQIVEEITAGKTLEDAAAEHGMPVQSTDLFTRLEFVPGIGQYNSVIGTAFGTPQGQIGGPAEADGRLYFLRVDERVAASRDGFEASKESVRAQLTRQRREAAIDEWLADLRERADIKDWRKQVFVPRS